jgi:hypothetical protein
MIDPATLTTVFVIASLLLGAGASWYACWALEGE